MKTRSTPLHVSPERTALHTNSQQNKALVRFAQGFPHPLSGLVQKFWGLECTWQFKGLWFQLPKAWQCENFLRHAIHQKRRNPDYERTAFQLELRLNESLRDTLLTYSLGESTQFPKGDHSALEYFLLRRFLEQALNALSEKNLVDKPVYPLLGETPDLAHLLFMPVNARLNEANANGAAFPKLLVSLPVEVALALGEQIPPPPPMSWPDFLAWNETQQIDVMTPLRLHAGLTHLRLADLKQLEPGDLIVLDESDTGTMGFMHPATQALQAFQVQFDAERIEHIPPQDIPPQPAQEATNAMPYPHTEMHEETRDAIWDQLHVEVHAEFKPMRLPIQELRSMCEGLIVEVGDLLNSEVQLLTNDTVVAHGQLVVVGDKFGVLLTQVPGYKAPQLEPLSEPEPPVAPVQPVEEEPEPQQQPQQAAPQPHPETPLAEQSAPETDAAEIDPQLQEFCEAYGIEIPLAMMAQQVGVDLGEVVEQSQAQEVDPNDYLRHIFTENNIPIPGTGGEEEMSEVDDELDRTAAMMEEMEDILDEAPNEE